MKSPLSRIAYNNTLDTLSDGEMFKNANTFISLVLFGGSYDF